MMFSRGQAADGFEQIASRQVLQLRSSFPDNHLSQNRTADQRWRTAIREIASLFDSVVVDKQRETQAIAADGIALLGDDTCAGQFTGVARMREMIFKCRRVRHVPY